MSTAEDSDGTVKKIGRPSSPYASTDDLEAALKALDEGNELFSSERGERLSFRRFASNLT